jgi:hypothetical protein
LSSEQLNAVGKKVVEACGQIPGMQWVHSHLTADGKHSFCEFLAPNPDACRQHAQLAGLPVDDVIPVQDEIGPQLFR